MSQRIYHFTCVYLAGFWESRKENIGCQSFKLHLTVIAHSEYETRVGTWGYPAVLHKQYQAYDRLKKWWNGTEALVLTESSREISVIWIWKSLLNVKLKTIPNTNSTGTAKIEIPAKQAQKFVRYSCRSLWNLNEKNLSEVTEEDTSRHGTQKNVQL